MNELLLVMVVVVIALHGDSERDGYRNELNFHL